MQVKLFSSVEDAIKNLYKLIFLCFASSAGVLIVSGLIFIKLNALKSVAPISKMKVVSRSNSESCIIGFNDLFKNKKDSEILSSVIKEQISKNNMGLSSGEIREVKITGNVCEVSLKLQTVLRFFKAELIQENNRMVLSKITEVESL
jgi:hypothetical protein